MTISQISVFTESKPGHLAKTLQIFEDAHVNVRGFSVSDTGEYGIARFIVDKPTVAEEALKAKGCAYTLTQVLCLRLEDRPGELARIMGVLASCEENVLYSYSMISTYIVISTRDIEKTKEHLKGQPVELVHEKDLLNLEAL